MTRVLIVDDNSENVYLLRALLQGNGCVVEEASHGAEALIKARQTPPDLLISDLLMPVMDGYTLLKHCKADDRLKTIPFVVYTATYIDAKDERLALSLGADKFLIKPAEPEAFMTSMREVLAKKERGELPTRTEGPMGETALLQAYSDVLVHKLEDKIFQLERSNFALKEELGRRQQMQAELHLRDRAMQAVSQGIIITDPNQPDNPIIYASAGFQRITGYSPGEIAGRNCRFLQGKDTDWETVGKLREAIAAGRACQLELLNYRKDGSAYWNALSVNPVFDEQGKINYFVGVQADVTDRKKLEEQLRQSQKMEAVGMLAGGIAHDFNNLLTIISGYSQVLLAKPDVGSAMREPIKAISQASERAATLTRQLLGFSRQTLLQPVVLDLNAVVDETCKMLRRLIGEDILLTTVLEPKLSRVRVDPGQLDQVLMNLAVNARDAMPKGGKLTIETSNIVLGDDYAGAHLESGAGPHVMLVMSDNGCGMPPEVLAHIFEPFYTTKGVGKGTGLGLAMVHGIVQQSGGCIHVSSELDRGTTFKIYFPAVAELLPEQKDPLADAVAGGSETILLVEDDEGVRGLARVSLAMHGYNVLTANDGKHALGILQEHQGTIDLVLTDVVMPNVSGPELAAALRSRWPRIRFLFMSGYTDDAMVRHGLLHAEVAFIQKPYSPLALARKVREVLDAPRKGS